jgi:raffinose/stachyose/melibiose transport system substrate-binding protein
MVGREDAVSQDDTTAGIPADEDGSVTRGQFLKRAGAVAAGAAVGGSAFAEVAGARISRPAISVKEKVSLTYWTWAWPPDPKQKAAAENAFAKAEPTIDLQVKQFSFPDYQLALKTGVPNGTAGEVLGLQTGSMGRTYHSFLLPLDKLAARDLGGTSWSEHFGSFVAECRTLDPAGKQLYALPHWASIGGVMWYNRGLLKYAGVKGVPKNYEELKAAAVKLRAKGIAPLAGGFKDKWPTTDYLIMFASQFKPGVVEAAELGKASFTDPAIVKALAFFKRTIDDGIWEEGPFASTAFPGAYVDLFNRGKAGMVQAGTWYSGALTSGTFQVKGAMKDWEVMLFPHIPGAPQSKWLGKLPSGMPGAGGPAASHPWSTANTVLGIRKDISAEKQDAAWRFVRYMVGKKGQQANAVWATPARDDVAIPGLTRKWQKIFAWHGQVGKQAERREFLYAETREALQTAIEDVCVNGTDPAKALAAVDEAAARGRKRAA